MSEKICQVCQMPAVDRCPNTLEYPAGGSIMHYEGEEIFSEVCPNMKVIALRQRLLKIDPQLLRVKHDASTPLYQTGECDRTHDNLLLTQIDWKVFLRHFKWVLASKDTNFFVQISTEATLKQIYMGEASVRARLPTQREDGDLHIFNSLEDLLAGPDLMIIRVGFIVYFNKAMASILLEALMLRDGLGKPTWIVEAAGQEFKPWSKSDYGISSGMPCCNEDVQRFVAARFESMGLESDEEPVTPPTEEHDGEVSARATPGEAESLEDVPASDEDGVEVVGDDEPASEEGDESGAEEVSTPQKGSSEAAFLDEITAKRKPAWTSKSKRRDY